jgi:hypothetical protein
MAFKMAGFSGFKQTEKDYEKEGYGDEALVSGAAGTSASYVETPPVDWAGVGQKAVEGLVESGIFSKDEKVDPKEIFEESIKKRNESELWKNSQLKKDIEAQEAGTKERIDSIITSMRPVPLEIKPPKPKTE